MGCCPLDKRVGCEALPADRLVGVEGVVGAKEMNVPYGILEEWGGSRLVACQDGEENWRWKAKDGEQLKQKLLN